MDRMLVRELVVTTNLIVPKKFTALEFWYIPCGLKYISFLLKFGSSCYREILAMVIFIVVRFDLLGLFVLLWGSLEVYWNILINFTNENVQSWKFSGQKEERTNSLVFTDQITHKLILHRWFNPDILVFQDLNHHFGLFVDINKPVISVLIIPNWNLTNKILLYSYTKQE